MTETAEPSAQTKSDLAQDSYPEIKDFPEDIARNRYTANFVNIERRSQSNTVFLVDDHSFSSIIPRPLHWSVPWSDLMMTMFILFLSMYAYQSTQQEFLGKQKPEIIGGDTTEALQSLDDSRATLPISPIRPGLPLITAGTVKKVDRVPADRLLQGESPLPPPADKPPPSVAKESARAAQETAASVHPETLAVTIDSGKGNAPPLAVPPVPLPNEDVLGPNPIVPSQTAPPAANKFQEMYTLGKDALESNNLNKFAAIDIVPDKTVRIVLTGDLLFNLGENELSGDARNSLQKIVEIIRDTPYMINVVGHTDNIPMRSTRFKSNWELSVARASTVARYLIEEIGMDPNQFVASGYSSYRPLVPNITAENRAKNRRVEIIVSKRLPEPLPATAENLR